MPKPRTVSGSRLEPEISWLQCQSVTHRNPRAVYKIQGISRTQKSVCSLQDTRYQSHTEIRVQSTIYKESVAHRNPCAVYKIQGISRTQKSVCSLQYTRNQSHTEIRVQSTRCKISVAHRNPCAVYNIQGISRTQKSVCSLQYTRRVTKYLVPRQYSKQNKIMDHSVTVFCETDRKTISCKRNSQCSTHQ